MIRSFFLCLLMLAPKLVEAASIQPLNSLERSKIIHQAHVWAQPKWISEDFEFDPQFDVKKAPPVPGQTALSETQVLECDYVPRAEINGKTSKFFCVGLNPDGKREQFKIKYGVTNAETNAEIAATRLLYALGFEADRMYPVQKVICRGCPSADPFSIRQGKKGDYVFENVAVERKLPGITVEQEENQGWSWDELFDGYDSYSIASLDQPRRKEVVRERVHRDALRLLAVFLQHADNKPEQQRVVCQAPARGSSESKCQGPVTLIIQDVGATFGNGASTLRGKINAWSKAHSDEWAAKPIWAHARTCQARINRFSIGAKTLVNPVISEEGRQFLSRLLTAFSKGPAGRKRVRDLFEVSRADVRMALFRAAGRPITEADRLRELENWIQIFIKKTEEIRSPVDGDSDFHCPTSVENLDLLMP